MINSQKQVIKKYSDYAVKLGQELVWIQHLLYIHIKNTLMLPGS